MTYKVTETNISGLKVLEAETHCDERGSFTEIFNHKDFTTSIGCEFEFVQDNLSISKKNVLRGLHIQVEAPQGKLVRVTSGAIYDVAVDLRRNSATFGSWFGVELSAENRKCLWIPEGFAHGFLALKDCTEVFYKVTKYYDAKSEKVIKWNDADIGIAWPITKDVILSTKDAQALSFKNFCQTT